MIIDIASQQIDRMTRWPEVIPIPDMTAPTVAEALISTWISRFGCPSLLTSDQGRQFESDLANCLYNYLGIKRIRTTSYHPQSNGLIENFHRTLKASLTALLDNVHWSKHLPIILLYLRLSVSSNTEFSPADALYGQPLRLPGDFFMPGPNKSRHETIQHIENAVNAIRNLRAHSSKKTYIAKQLSDCTHVFLHDDMVRPPLTPAYKGPFKVLKRNNKTFVIEQNTRPVHVSIDRLKPAFLLPTDSNPTSTENPQKTPIAELSTLSTDKPSQKSEGNKPNLPSILRTRFGRTIKPVVRFSVNS